MEWSIGTLPRSPWSDLPRPLDIAPVRAVAPPINHQERIWTYIKAMAEREGEQLTVGVGFQNGGIIIT